jgi:hypothetical protein
LLYRLAGNLQISSVLNVCLWPIAEIVDAEIQAHLSSALERKAAICQPGVLISASDPKQLSESWSKLIGVGTGTDPSRPSAGQRVDTCYSLVVAIWLNSSIQYLKK